MSEVGGQQYEQGTVQPGGPPTAGQPVAGGASGPRAGFWQRLGAYLIDAVIVAIVEIILIAILHSAGQIISFIASYAYFTYLEGGAAGQTIGMRVLGIRVIDANAGGSIGYGRGFVRQLGKIVSTLGILLGWFWMLWDPENQTWHDKIASSYVVPVDAYPVN